MLQFNPNGIKEGHMSYLSVSLFGTSALLVDPGASQVRIWQPKVHFYVAVRSCLADQVATQGLTDQSSRSPSAHSCCPTCSSSLPPYILGLTQVNFFQESKETLRAFRLSQCALVHLN